MINFRKVFIGMAALIGCHAIQLTMGITVRNPLTVIFFVVMLLGYYCIPKTGIKGVIISIPASFFATYFSYKGVVSRFNSGLFKGLSILILFSGFFFVAYLLVGGICLLLDKEKRSKLKRPDLKAFVDIGKEPYCGLKAVFAIAGICLICWLPYFLYEFPGIMTADSLVQYGQIIGAEPRSNHHPILHTLIIKFFYNIGFTISGSKIIGIAFYTAFQMIFMAFCCGNLVCHIKKRNMQIFAVAFFALVPFNAVFAVTIWKDILFAGVTMLLICQIMDLTEDSNGADFFAWGRFAVLGILFALLRSNAWYALIVWTPFALFAFKSNVKKIVVSMLIILVSVITVKGPIMYRSGIVQPDFTESLSVPIQQIARILVEDKEITVEERKSIESVIDTTYIHELYAADFADNMKELVRAGHPDVIEKNKSAFMKLWMNMVREHPIEAIKASYDLVGGYIYPDFSYDVGNIDGIMSNDYGLYWNPIIGGKAFIKAKEIFIKLGNFIPIYGMLWSIGTYTLLLVFTFIYNLSKKRTVLCETLLLMLVGTLLIAAPVVDFRYGYAVVMTMPLWISRLFDKKER